MKRIIELLSEKNSYLEKFFDLNADWLSKLTKDDFSDLERFRESREDILNIVKHLDFLLEAKMDSLNPVVVTLDEKTIVNDLLEKKDNLVRGILNQDIDIMSIIESAKSKIIVELKELQKGRKGISSYKSFQRKETVDEEA